MADGQRRWSGSGRRNARRRRHRALHRRQPRTTGAHDAAHAAPADARKPRGPARNLALADFVAPKETGMPDYIGGVRGDRRHRRATSVAKTYERRHDDYGAILLKALADRLAEAFAERMHERVRTRALGLRHRTKRSTNDELIREKYRGIRPAPGYPAQPGSHREGDAVRAARRRAQRRHRS
ncbi:MAG: hypothetical protein MZV49_09765 [Rhodopseudomonas palustris]|nr:hypothetical protein [Rhodopseudomonas palustris]